MPRRLSEFASYQYHLWNVAGAKADDNPAHDEENSSSAANRRPPGNNSAAWIPEKAWGSSNGAAPAIARTPAEQIQLLHFLCMAVLDTGILRSALPQNQLLHFRREIVLHWSHGITSSLIMLPFTSISFLCFAT